jgi:hypothetical protein
LKGSRASTRGLEKHMGKLDGKIALVPNCS